METINVFYQGHGIEALEHLEIGANETFASLKVLITKKHNLADETLIFIEDEVDQIDLNLPISEKAGRAGVKIHLHRCLKVRVVVHYNQNTVHHEFSPGATIARVKHWAAEKKFGMSPEDASNHHLQLSGTMDQPDPGTHIGSLTDCSECKVEFDLVPTPRVNGAK